MGFGKKKTPKIEPIPEPPEIEDPAMEEARRLERERLRKKRGRTSTILTGSGGVTEEAFLGRKTLLGQ
jgi:hypothetical protein